MRRFKMFETLVATAVLTVGSMTGSEASVDPAEPGHDGHPRYEITVLGPLAGATTNGSTINDRGQVAGFSTTDEGDIHATVWRRDEPQDLGTLGGPGSNSAVLWPNKNNGGLVVGITQTDTPDPNNEPWSCASFLPARPGYACVGFVWRDGQMMPLRTLGGTHGFATSINNRNQIVGWAENTVVDDTCVDGQVLQFRAVRWDRIGKRTTELAPLAGDTTSAATAINDSGRVVGISGSCDQAVGRSSARAAVVWDHGRPRALPDLGGTAWNTPMSLNRRGDIVGFLNRSEADGTSFRPLPVWWTATGRLHRLDIPEGLPFGQALGINARRQIVGVAFSADFGQCRAMLWKRGRGVLLHDRSRHRNLELCTANDINNRGQITGQATDPDTGSTVAFRAEERRH